MATRNVNPGPASQNPQNRSIALSNIYGLFSVSATLKLATYNDLTAPTLWGYSSGSTTRLLLTPAPGNTTINGLDSSGVIDGFTMLFVNQSTTDSLIFAHLASGSQSANQFSNMSAGSVAILPLGAARCTYVVSKWQFA